VLTVLLAASGRRFYWQDLASEGDSHASQLQHVQALSGWGGRFPSHARTCTHTATHTLPPERWHLLGSNAAPRDGA